MSHSHSHSHVTREQNQIPKKLPGKIMLTTFQFEKYSYNM